VKAVECLSNALKTSKMNKADIELFSRVFSWTCQGDYPSLKAALRDGVSVNIIDPQTTDSPLMVACRKGYDSLVCSARRAKIEGKRLVRGNILKGNRLLLDHILNVLILYTS
jgi:hypothetical protein